MSSEPETKTSAWVARKPPSGTASASPLTDRQAAIMCAVARGRTTGSIARAIGVSPETVGREIKTLCEDWSAQNRTHLVAILLLSAVLEVESIEG